jgi:hypothetical protein
MTNTPIQIAERAPSRPIQSELSREANLSPKIEAHGASQGEDHAGEVETHVLSVYLSDIAKKFLEVEEFFKTGQPFHEEPEYPSSGFFISEEELNEENSSWPICWHC